MSNNNHTSHSEFTAVYARLVSFVAKGRWPTTTPAGKTKREELTVDELEEAQLRCEPPTRNFLSH